MKIIAGESVILANSLMGDTVSYNGQMVDSIKIILNQDVTQEEIDALSGNDWNLFKDDDEPLGVHSGYNTVYQHTIAFVKVPDIVKENEALKAQLAELKEALNKMQNSETEAVDYGDV